MSRQDPQSYRRSLLRIPEEDAESAVGGPADAGAAGGHRICCCPVSAQQAQAFNQMMDFSLFRSVFTRRFLVSNKLTFKSCRLDKHFGMLLLCLSYGKNCEVY
jgi:hypothetical protein